MIFFRIRAASRWLPGGKRPYLLGGGSTRRKSMKPAEPSPTLRVSLSEWRLLQRLAAQANLAAANAPPPAKAAPPKPEHDAFTVAQMEKLGIRVLPGSEYVTPAQRMARKVQG